MMHEEKIIRDMSTEEYMEMLEHFDHVYSLILDLVLYKEYSQESKCTLFDVWEKINYHKNQARKIWTYEQFISPDEKQ